MILYITGQVYGDADLNGDGDYSDSGETGYGGNDIFLSVLTVTYNTAPTLTSLTVTPATDGTGEVSIVSTVNDTDANELSISYHFNSGDCTSLPSSTTTISSASSTYGTPTVGSGTYQVTTVTTTPGANTVTSTWTSATDASGANGTSYCLYAYAYDGTTTSTLATTTVTLDNTAPSSTSITGFTTASTTLTPAWSTATGASTYTVSSTATSDVTTSSVSYEYTGLTPNTNYTFQVKATDSYGNASSYSTATSTHTNPAKPLSVAAVANGPSAINLSWSANGNPTSTVYKIYNYSKGTVVGTTTSTSYTTTGLASASNYYFAIRAVYNSDSTSYVESSASQTVTTAAPAQAVTLTITTSTAGVAIPFSFKDSNESHTATLNSITDGVASLTIQSTPVTVSLSSGQSQRIDTGTDGINDTIVTMNDVTAGSASFTLTTIPLGDGNYSSMSVPSTNSTSKSVKAVTIDGGSLTTQSQNVTLTMNVADAALMAVSNEATFNDVSFETYTGKKTWTLTPGNGKKTVFVKFRSASGGMNVYSAVIILSGQTFDDKSVLHTSEETTTDVKNTTDTKTPDTTCLLTPGKAYRSISSRAVYYVTQTCTKRPFRSSTSYFTYFSGWDDVHVVSKSLLDRTPDDALFFMPLGPRYNPQYGALVKTLDDPKVYLLLNDKKYWITDEAVFTALKYTSEWIEGVDQSLLDKYTTGEEITDKDHHPVYTLIKYQNSPKVYRLEPSTTDNTLLMKRHILNNAIFEALGFRGDRIVTVPDTETYDTGDAIESVK